MVAGPEVELHIAFGSVSTAQGTALRKSLCKRREWLAYVSQCSHGQRGWSNGNAEGGARLGGSPNNAELVSHMASTS